MPAEKPVDQEVMKRAAGSAALAFVEAGSVIGIGSGTTAWAFVDVLAGAGVFVVGAVVASRETARRVESAGIPVLQPGDAAAISLYVDGADEVDALGRAIKGRGGAHTREKVLAAWAHRWVCVVDITKVAEHVGSAPVPLEVLAFALEPVKQAVVALGATAEVRSGFLTDDGNPVLDVSGLAFDDPLGVEAALESIPGVVGNGVFARRRADIVLVGHPDGSATTIETAHS